jgi:hypothetical protein
MADTSYWKALTENEGGGELQLGKLAPDCPPAREDEFEDLVGGDGMTGVKKNFGPAVDMVVQAFREEAEIVNLADGLTMADMPDIVRVTDEQGEPTEYMCVKRKPKP